MVKPTMGSNIKTSTLFLIFVTFTTVAAQTFQYSRGWTNGKRAYNRNEGRELAGNLEKILSPCQMNKLKYVLEGRPLSERLLLPCDYSEEDETQPKRYKSDHSQDTLFDSL